ncbi:MAG: hydrolase [Myxococcales bacterium]|nr:hydrolase [Myxococcales bacterium]
MRVSISMAVLLLAGCTQDGLGPTPGTDGGGASDFAAGNPATDLAVSARVCTGKTGAKGDRTLMITSGGMARTSQLHVPDRYDPAAPTTLVLNFHGLTSNPDQQKNFSKMIEESDARGFLVAHAQGIQNSWNAGSCCGGAASSGVDDVAFVRALTAQIASEYCVDPRRIFSTGLSNGGYLSYRLACEASDLVAAIGPVAGTLRLSADQCKPPRPVPVIHFHGTSDPLVAYSLVAPTIAVFRALDGCAATSTITYKMGDATCETWSTCAAGSAVTSCTIEGGGHTWPGGNQVPFLGKTSADISATKTMLDFFEAHPMP